MKHTTIKLMSIFSLLILLLSACGGGSSGNTMQKNSAVADQKISPELLIDIAHKFGVATEGTDKSYYYYQPASYAIDHNASTYNHTSAKSDQNWWQVALPVPAAIHKIVIQSRMDGGYSRLAGAKVYICDRAYDANLTKADLVATLQGIKAQQIFTFNPPKKGKYLIVKAADDQYLHMSSVKIYGKLGYMPDFKVQFPQKNYLFALKLHMKPGTVIGVIQALNYANKKLHYSLVGNAAFRIDATSGALILQKALDSNKQQRFHFLVKVDDGENSAVANVTVAFLSKNGVKLEDWYNIGGYSIEAMLASKHYRNDPADATTFLSTFNTESQNKRDNFAQKLTAVISPMHSGKYTFALVGDYRARLSLDGTVIADYQGPDSYSYQNWDRAKKSPTVYLEKGRIYHLELLHKEWGGLEYVSLAWKRSTEKSFHLIDTKNLFIELLNKDNVKPQIAPIPALLDLKSANTIGSKVITLNTFDAQDDLLTYTIAESVPFYIDSNGSLYVNGSLEKKIYHFSVEVSDGTSTVTTPITIQSDTDTHRLNATKKSFEEKARAFRLSSDVDDLVESYTEYSFVKARDIYGNFMPQELNATLWSWLESDQYIKEGLSASRFPISPYSIKNLVDFKSNLERDGNGSLFNNYKNVFLGLAVNAKERGINQEAVFGDTNEHRTIDYTKLAAYEAKERVWLKEHTLKDLGDGISYYEFRNYLRYKYDLSASEADTLYASTARIARMARDDIDTLHADYETRKEYGLSFDGLNLYRMAKGFKRAECYAEGNPCQRIKEWLDNNGVSASEFLIDFEADKSKVGLIHANKNMTEELSALLNVAPNEYKLMTFYELAKWKIALDEIPAIEFNDNEPNWPLFNASLRYSSTVSNSYPWQLFALEQSAQQKECHYVKERFFETDKEALKASYPPNAVDNREVKAERRFIEYTTYTWAYNDPKVWFRTSDWSPHRTVYRILQDGGVCGRQSTMGQHVNECLNRPSIGVGQPGHRAWVGVYNYPKNRAQYYIKIGYQVGSKESASAGMNLLYDRYTKGIRDRGIERFGGVVTGVSPAGVGEHIYNESMILQHIGAILQKEGIDPSYVLKKAVALAPTNVDAWYQLALYYASIDEPNKVVDLADEFMSKRNSFFLDDDKKRGSENLEVITGRVIAFIALKAASVADGHGERAEEIKERLWDYIATYEADDRSFRSYGYQNRYLAQLYLVRQKDKSAFVDAVEELFESFLGKLANNEVSGWYMNNYFSNVTWSDLNKTALFDNLALKADEAQISEAQRKEVYEKLLGRTQNKPLAVVSVDDICDASKLSQCQSLQHFRLDSKTLYMVAVDKLVGDDQEVAADKRGEAGYSTLILPTVDDKGKEQDIKIRIAKVATKEGVDGKLLKINDPSSVESNTTEVVAWIQSGDNLLDPKRVYRATHRVILKVKKRVTNNEESMGDVVLNLQNCMLGDDQTITQENWSSQTFHDDSTSIYFVALNDAVGPTKGVWFHQGYSEIAIAVIGDNGEKNRVYLRGQNNDYTMNSGENADWDNTLKLVYDDDDNNLTSGVHYKSIMPVTIDAKMWHKNQKLLHRFHINIDITAP
jgi:hypothetical protein